MFAALSIAAISACSPEAAGQTPPPPPDVGVAKVVSRPVREWDEFTGRITAVETVDLRARVSGYVERVVYEEGQEINKGDLLFAIDERRYRNQLDSALAESGTRSQRSPAGAGPGHARADLARQQLRLPRPGGHAQCVRHAEQRGRECGRGRRGRGQAQSRIHPGEVADFGPRRPRAGDGRQSRPGRYDVADHPGVAQSGLCLLRQRRARLSALCRAGPPGRTQRIAQCGARRPCGRAGLSARRHGRLHRSSGQFKHRHHPHPRHPRKMPIAGSRPACSRACNWKAPANPPPC